MATQELVFRSTYVSRSRLREFITEHTKWLRSILPRPCMLISVGLLLAGLSIPFLMGLTILPSSLFLGFLGMASASIGSVLTLYYL